jgi:hypothetical protein
MEGCQRASTRWRRQLIEDKGRSAYSPTPCRPASLIREILTAENEDLRQLLWTTNRSLPSRLRANLAAALRYELAGGTPMPGYDQLGDAPRS